MKKLVLFLAAALICFSAGAITLEEVVGKWESKSVNVPTGSREVKVSMVITLDMLEDGNIDTEFLTMTRVTVDQGQYVDYNNYQWAKGTYAVEADSIVITLDPATLKVEMPIDEISTTGIDDPQMETQIRNQFEQASQEIASHQSEIAEAAQEEGTIVLNQVMIIGKKMAATIDDMKVSFSRKKKK